MYWAAAGAMGPMRALKTRGTHSKCTNDQVDKGERCIIHFLTSFKYQSRQTLHHHNTAVEKRLYI